MEFLKKFLRLGRPAVVFDSWDRPTDEVTTNLTPEKINAIMIEANSGDTERQCRLATEILEKNHDIMQALSTRRNSVLGCDWSVEPGDDSIDARNAAEALKRQLDQSGQGDDLDTFDDLLDDLLGALLPGFAVSELVWRNGGEIAGFKHIPQRAFTFRDGFTPKLVTRTVPLGIELPRERIIFHRLRLHGPDPARGGLIRPLAWLHCFGNLHLKDLLSFIERYGMPFIMIRADDASYERERNTIKRLIRNFGSNGGGLFTRNVEAELLQASSNTGEVYFRLLEYCEAAINKIVLGQTASSGDSSGLSKGDAQSKVRQDILESDCRWLERSINAQLFGPWCRYNYGGSVAAPQLSIDCTPPEDKSALATTLQALAAAGFEADPDEVSKRVGIQVVRRMEPQPAASLPAAPAASQEDPDAAHTLNLKQKYDAMGVAIRAGLLTATPEIEEQTRRELGLPPISDAVRKSWEATGGIRQPITLKTNESAAVETELDVDDKAAENVMIEEPEPLADTPDEPPANELSEALDEWLGAVADEMTAISKIDDPDEFAKRLEQLASGDLLGDSGRFENLLSQTIADGIESGRKRRGK